MITTIQNQTIHYKVEGKGLPLIILHGLYLDSISMIRAIEDTSINLEGFKRIYIDMPGMGQSPKHTLANNSDTMINLIGELISTVINDHPFIIMGFSYGGYIAQGIAKKFKGQVIGEVLICPVVVPDPKKRRIAPITTHDIDQKYFESLSNDQQQKLLKTMVVINEKSVTRNEFDFSRAVALADKTFIRDLFQNGYSSQFIEGSHEKHDHKALIYLGYQDNSVGYLDMLERLTLYTKATVNLITNASHPFFLEQPKQFEFILNSWLGQYKL